MHRNRTIWGSRSPIAKWAHVIERTGLAAAGAAAALFVVVAVGRANVNLPDLGLLLIVVALGAISFYLGIDFPGPSDLRVPISLLRVQERGSLLLDLLGAFGTFLAAMTAFISVLILVLDEPPSRKLAVIIGAAWLIGSAGQICAGIAIRIRISLAARDPANKTSKQQR